MSNATPTAPTPVRVVTKVGNVQRGDTIRVKDHMGHEINEQPARWHQVSVLQTEVHSQQVVMATDRWPIAYVAARGTLVELVDIEREVTFVCTVCRETVNVLTATLSDFYDADLAAQGGLRVLEIESLEPAVQNGLCADHAGSLLD